jgi:hypothetical protein
LAPIFDAATYKKHRQWLFAGQNINNPFTICAGKKEQHGSFSILKKNFKW